MPSDLRSELGEDWDNLAQLAREDERRHEEAINEHHRTTLTIRGFAVTAVAALIAATFVSNSAIPAGFAVLLSFFFCFVDFYYSRLYTQVERRLKVIEQLDRRYRRLLSRRSRTPKSLQRLRVDLLTYSSGPAIPRMPNLRPVRPLGRSFTVFLPLYFGLVIAALLGGAHALRSEAEAVSRVNFRCLGIRILSVGEGCGSIDRTDNRAPQKREALRLGGGAR